jgi:hypothetical protein
MYLVANYPGFPESSMTTQQQLALGRIFRLMSRPFQEGDIEQYEAARSTFLTEGPQPEPPDPYQVNWARDRKLACAGGQD